MASARDSVTSFLHEWDAYHSLQWCTIESFQPQFIYIYFRRMRSHTRSSSPLPSSSYIIYRASCLLNLCNKEWMVNSYTLFELIGPYYIFLKY